MALQNNELFNKEKWVELSIIVKIIFGRVHILSNNLPKLLLVIYELLKQSDSVINVDVKKSIKENFDVFLIG